MALGPIDSEHLLGSPRLRRAGTIPTPNALGTKVPREPPAVAMLPIAERKQPTNATAAGGIADGATLYLSIEPMSGIKTIFKKRCAVTAFDQKLHITTDGRERGVWVGVEDESQERHDFTRRAVNVTLESLVDMINFKAERAGHDAISVDFSVIGTAGDLTRMVRESSAVLMEWKEVKALHAALGRALEDHKTKGNT